MTCLCDICSTFQHHLISGYLNPYQQNVQGKVFNYLYFLALAQTVNSSRQGSLTLVIWLTYIVAS